MRPLTQSTSISAPREQVFAFVGDLANHVAFNDHFCEDYRLARPRSDGLGATARFKLNPPGPHIYVESQIVEWEAPRKIVFRDQWGRNARSAGVTVYEFIHDDGGTRVELTVSTEPGHKWDAYKEKLGARRWMKRKNTVLLKRLREVFEDPPEGKPLRVGMAGYDPLTAPRFGGHPPIAALRGADAEDGE